MPGIDLFNLINKAEYFIRYITAFYTFAAWKTQY
jgi:hypothetical protein